VNHQRNHNSEEKNKERFFLGGGGLGIAHRVSSGEVELGIFHYFYPHIINYYICFLIYLLHYFLLFSIFYFRYYFFYSNVQQEANRMGRSMNKNTSKWTCLNGQLVK
jgi:hypothetical protein